MGIISFVFPEPTFANSKYILLPARFVFVIDVDVVIKYPSPTPVYFLQDRNLYSEFHFR